jgi:hypothetical protein
VVIVWWIVVRRWRLFERRKFSTFSNFIFGWTSSMIAFRRGMATIRLSRRWGTHFVAVLSDVGHPARTEFFP